MPRNSSTWPAVVPRSVPPAVVTTSPMPELRAIAGAALAPATVAPATMTPSAMTPACAPYRHLPVERMVGNELPLIAGRGYFGVVPLNVAPDLGDTDKSREGPMTVLELSRWQFGITTVYHFIFVPLTIGLSILVACMQTAWLRKKDPVYLRMTKFFGTLFLINFAVGVVTGIVEEFQFGMNWSAYSAFVGNVFGAPLAMEALLAFFLESTFIGLWIFGWNKLPPRLHLATIWVAALATNLSAYVILAAGIATAVTGDIQARLMDSQQPMKMAAAEALYNTTNNASFSLFTIG